MAMEVRYELPDPAYEAYTWILQDEHMQGVQPHLMWDGGFFPTRAPKEGEVPMMTRVNGYPYARAEASGQNPFGSITPPESVADLTRWRQEWLPQVDAFAESLESFDPASVEQGTWSTTLRDQDREMGRVFSGIHLNTVMNGYQAVEAFTKAYVDRFGEDSRADTLQLLQGFPNLSLDRASALWDLSRLALSDAALVAALEAGASIPDSAAGREFNAGLQSLLDRFGYTTNIGGAHLPSWSDDPSIPLALVKSYLRLGEDRGPRAAAEQQRRARIAVEEKLMASAGANSELPRLLEMAQQYMPNLEDHNLLCDQRVGTAMRNRWRSAGRFLMARGLASEDDVFFYRRPELIAALDGGDLLAKPIIDERRALIAAVALNPPPARLGKVEANGAAAEATASGGRVTLRGVGASKGTYTGRARIIETLDDAGRLEDGDVLVCRMTAPPWTPLFATIGALVVNTGGMLSHGAVVAREFGIPAVVATTHATAMIPDGATVTVDGTNGVVVVEQP